MTFSDTQILGGFVSLGASLGHLYWDRLKTQRRLARVEAMLEPAAQLADSVGACPITDCPHRSFAMSVKGGLKRVSGAGSALLALFFSSCTVIHGNREKGSYLYASVGGDASELAQTSEGVTVAAVDNSKSFKELSGAAKSAIWAGALRSVANTAGTALTKVSKSKEATSRVGLTEKGLTDRAGIAADVEKARIAATPTEF
jgi:hypothetical protein